MDIEYSIRLRDSQLEALRLIGGGHVVEHPDMIELGWPSPQARRIFRSLYGIIGIQEDRWLPGGIPRYGRARILKYRGFFLPPENAEAVSVAMENRGVFQKSIKLRDVHILRTIVERDKELKEMYSACWNPRFYEEYIAQLARMGYDSTRSSLNRLVGLVGKTYNHDAYKELTWIVPTARRPQIEAILDQYPANPKH